ncbi:hypothetical protein LEP1GSC050_2538 [Leptospira broomii serovar Hurstbridge str. 5399]|uniref:Uncharacterized protein n=1 Tax=Leptospira broomii serovar Hurstbridge str. 5399 TaxID=1049789 RepID=T0GEQ4_9LEPT|nr:hypothetical protein [Leptospira broomii]EQA45304.1 hypothetical protein LEP1GSC050_2538 [Leptospira broomii serovar Hurstbridge str. 5399]
MNWQKIKNVFRHIHARWEKFYAWIFSLSTLPANSSETRRLLFLTYSWILFLLFLTGFVLAGKNPLKLLVPFALYDLPNFDPRKSLIVYGSDGEGEIFTIHRKVLLDGKDFRHDVITLVGEVGEASFFDPSVPNDAVHFRNLKKLPNLQDSVISIWKRGDLLILDMRKSTLEDLLSEMKFRIDYTYASQMSEEEKSREITRRKLALLSSSFLAVERTLFENYPELNRIEYRLGGEQEEIPGLNYSLTESHLRKNEPTK